MTSGKAAAPRFPPCTRASILMDIYARLAASRITERLASRPFGTVGLAPDFEETLNGGTPIASAPEGDRFAAIVAHLASSSEEDALVTLDAVWEQLEEGGRLYLIARNPRHFFDIARAGHAGEFDREQGRSGVPLATLRDLLGDTGFDEIEMEPLRIGYGSSASEAPTGHQLDDATEQHAARIHTLAHAVLFTARRAEPRDERYSSDVLANLWESGELEEAAAYMKRQLALNPGRARVWSDAAVLLAEAGLADDALVCVRRAISCDAFHDAARANLADLLAQAGADIVKDGASFVEIEPIRAAQNAESYLNIERLDDALTWAELAFMRQPNTTTTDVLIRVLRRIGATRRAGEILTIVRQLLQDAAAVPPAE